jgi:hypothetical protein
MVWKRQISADIILAHLWSRLYLSPTNPELHRLPPSHRPHRLATSALRPHRPLRRAARSTWHSLNICYAFSINFRKGSQKHGERVTQGKEMAETVDEITVDWSDENGQQMVRQLKKEILTSGAWSTIMFLYQEFDKRAGDWGPKKVRVVRYQKRGGKYIPQSKFNVSSAKQARQIIESLQNWLPEMDNQGSSENFNGNSNVKP